MSSSGPGTGGSGWGERPTSGWDSKVPASGGGGPSGWDDGSSYKGSNNTSNTWSNNKDDRYLFILENTDYTIVKRITCRFKMLLKFFAIVMAQISNFLIDSLNCLCLGPAHGLTHQNHSRAGVPTVEMKAGVMVEMVPDQGPTTTGESPKKVQGQWAGTATVTAPDLDVGASQAELTTPAAATLGWGVVEQILQTRALQTQDPTGVTQSINPILKVTARAGASQ